MWQVCQSQRPNARSALAAVADAIASSSTPFISASARTVNGNVAVVVGLKNVAPTQVTWASIQQTGGSTWQWYRTAIEYPPLIIQL